MSSGPNLILKKYDFFQNGKKAELLDRLTQAKISNAFELASVLLIFWECSGLNITIQDRPNIVVRKDANVLQLYVAKILKETPPTDESPLSNRNTYDVIVIALKEFEKALANYFNDTATDKEIVKFGGFQSEFRRFLRQQFKEGKRYAPERPADGVKTPAEAARNET